MEWSVYFQNPEFMEKTRFHLIQPDMEPLVRKWCGVTQSSRILDVGCGTGYFTRLLGRGAVTDNNADARAAEAILKETTTAADTSSEATSTLAGSSHLTVTGLDQEQPFIDYARKRNEAEGFPVSYIQGNALELPFAADSFDIVASHTFLTVIPDPEKALSEMLRVLRPGGILASVTPMSFIPEVMDVGAYPPECTWAGEYTAMYSALYQAYDRVDPVMSYAAGLKPAEVPRFLAEHGLRDVSAYPLGKLFSLSNASMTEAEKLEWIEYQEVSELKKMDAYMTLPQMQSLFSSANAARFRTLMQEKCNWLRSHLQENAVWEWYGGANLLVTGRKPSSQITV